ncbi:clumping factor B [Drosophila albomicans]|uniref:Clumping factor B n=1 Tax=Drosophila albomicans TaxID=7291 RepID=A0A6P8WIX1_DROAB|nr:clumping factor B [Drosophila albomicans]
MPKVQLLITLLLLAFANADVSGPQDPSLPGPQTYAPIDETTKISTAVSSSSEPADTESTTVAAGDEEAKQDPEATPNIGNNQDVDGTPDADIKPDSDAKPDADATPDADIKPDSDAKPDADATPDADIKPDSDAKPDADATPDADKKPDTDTKPDDDTDVDAEDSAEEGIATTIEQLESSTTTPIEDTHHEHHQHSIGHVHAHDGFHDIKREKLWAHWNDAFTTTVGIEPDNSTMQ